MKDETLIEWAMRCAANYPSATSLELRTMEPTAEIIVTLADEVMVLRAIIEGSTDPPSDAVLAAHALAYPTGGWVVSRPDDDTSSGSLTGQSWADLAARQCKHGHRWRWIPLDGEGRPVARPVVTT